MGFLIKILGALIFLVTYVHASDSLFDVSISSFESELFKPKTKLEKCQAYLSKIHFGGELYFRKHVFEILDLNGRSCYNCMISPLLEKFETVSTGLFQPNTNFRIYTDKYSNLEFDVPTYVILKLNFTGPSGDERFSENYWIAGYFHRISSVERDRLILRVLLHGLVYNVYVPMVNIRMVIQTTEKKPAFFELQSIKEMNAYIDSKNLIEGAGVGYRDNAAPNIDLNLNRYLTPRRFQEVGQFFRELMKLTSESLRDSQRRKAEIREKIKNDVAEVIQKKI